MHMSFLMATEPEVLFKVVLQKVDMKMLFSIQNLCTHSKG